VVFEPTISAGERAQTYALDRAATAIGRSVLQLAGKKIIGKYKYRLFNQTSLPKPKSSWRPQAVKL